jgi:hypothetical protein
LRALWSANAYSNTNDNRNSDCNRHAYTMHREMFPDASTAPDPSTSPVINVHMTQ